MMIVHFFDNRKLVLTQFLTQIPSVDQNIKIKGRKGKVSSVTEIDENQFQVSVIFEQIIKNKALDKDLKKKKR